MSLASSSRPPVGTFRPFSQRRKRVTSIGSARVGYTPSPGFLGCNLQVFPVQQELMGISCSPIPLGPRPCFTPCTPLLCLCGEDSCTALIGCGFAPLCPWY